MAVGEQAVPHGTWQLRRRVLASSDEQRWPNLADLIVDKSADAPVGLVGAPLAAGSVTPGRCDLAPGLLRATLRRIGRYDVETGRELATQIADHGDVADRGAQHRGSDAADPRRRARRASSGMR